MSGETHFGDWELHAFIDGELAPDRTAEIAKRIETDAAFAKVYRSLLQDKQELGQLLASELDRPLPAQWLRLIEERRQTAWSSSGHDYLTRRRAFALAAAFVLIFGFGLLVRPLFAPGDDPILAEALAARQQSMSADAVLDEGALAAADARDRILADALEMPLSTPDLTKLGYRLDEIRVYSGVPGGKAVGLTYRDEGMRVFTLYLRRPSGPARVELFQRDGIRICIWQDDVLGTVMLGDMTAAAMARIASLAYSGLNS